MYFAFSNMVSTSEFIQDQVIQPFRPHYEGKQSHQIGLKYWQLRFKWADKSLFLYKNKQSQFRRLLEKPQYNSVGVQLFITNAFRANTFSLNV